MTEAPPAALATGLLDGLFSDAALAAIPVAMILLSLAAATAIFPLREDAFRARAIINLTAAAAKVALVVLLFPVVLDTGVRPEFRLSILPGLDLLLRVDPISLLFASLSAVLWLLTTIYAIGYLRGTAAQSRFFGFFSLCVTATVGIAFAGNLLTFLVFFEMLTLVTYPLVAHWGTAASLAAARLYLRYAMGGGLALLIGVIWLHAYAGEVDFVTGGSEGVVQLAAEQPGVAVLIFVLLIGGVGVKAALIGLHGWLPKAMVAPAPVSSLLHAVAVVKAGVFGIVRIVDDVFGIEVARELGVLTPLLIVASATILYGSYQALRQSDLKARLAYSTVSQVSYVTLGLVLATVAGTTGGLVHLVHQGVMKITMFFCAGLFKETMDVSRVEQMNGLGARMPLASAAFTVAGMGMIGLPPTAGFISKWQLGMGAAESEHVWVLGVLIASSLLNAAYFLPVIYRIWFRDPDDDVTAAAREAGARAVTTEDLKAAEGEDTGATAGAHVRVHEPRMMLVPALITAAAVLSLGLAASTPFSALDLARRVAEEVFR
ncbi:MAG: proton-conducting transporter membrane subunit [Micrococcus sp.]|nr:proton-conducting transporter membrane subunit [Micrococcus sp.]